VAPNNARDKLVALVASAKQTIDLEGEELSDSQVVAALLAARKAGVVVHAVLSNVSPTPAQQNAVQSLKAGGVQVKTLASPYVHAKALVVDGAHAYVGSENFTASSLVNNRELGVITNNATSAALVASTIAADFANGT
jgi:cardiolipin synthase